MPKKYLAPGYETLLTQTDKLKQNYNSLSKRYRPPKSEDLATKIGELENDYQNDCKEKRQSPNQIRLSQIALICSLRGDLLRKCASDKSEATRESAKHILLGAILYRYLRLKEEYENSFKNFKAVPFAFVGTFVASFTSEKNCKLLILLENLLNINEANQLDERTKAIYLSAYNNFLRTDDYSNRFPYIANSETFMSQLQETIATADKASVMMREELGFIDFIQSTAVIVVELDRSVTKILNELLIKISEKLKTEEFLNLEQVVDLLDSLKPEASVRAIIRTFLGRDLLIQKDGSFESQEFQHTSFADGIKAINTMNNKYTIIGSYLLVLRACESTEHKNVSKTINHALGIGIGNPLDIDTWKTALSYFKKFMTRADGALLSYEAWGGGGRERLEAIIVQLESDLLSHPELLVGSVASSSASSSYASSSSASP